MEKDNINTGLEYEKSEMPIRKIWGYSLGTMGEYMTYFLFTAFFMYYLTDYVDLSPAAASGIMTFGMFFAAICDPVIGYINDRSKNPKGRRRPLMVKAWFPFMIAFALCYVRPGLEGTALIAYYVIMMIILWLSYACMQIPFYGMMPEITHNSTDRMRIQTGVGVIGNGSNIFVSIQPIVFSFLLGLGVSEMTAWAVVMGSFGILGGTAYMSTWLTTKGMEKPIEKVENPEGNMFQIYWKLLKLKGYVPAVLVYGLCTIFININFYSLAYVTEGKLRLDAVDMSIVIACYTFAGIVFTPVISWMNKKLGARKALILVLIPVIVLNIIFGTIGISSMGMMMVHGLFTSATFVLATAFNYGLFYQLADYSILEYGEEMEGSLFAFATFGYKICGAIASLILGVFLTIIGYDGAANMDPAVMGRIDSLLTLFPAILLIICILLIVFLYPMNDELYLRVKEERRKRDAGEPHSTELLKEIKYGLKFAGK